MLLKYESTAIIQLYETGILADIELIENKLFNLEYGKIRVFTNQKKEFEKPIHLLRYFQGLSSIEINQWETLFKSRHRWFQPDSNLLERNQRVTNAYLIIRDLVQHKNGTSTTYYKCGNIIGADAFRMDLIMQVVNSWKHL
ncbi:unnamed protein product [Adineta ricciae]|uniref:Uncharacterized protein n=1 Tax=Adineta ricciae TaxID=249248 RepID=A0A814NQF5_ADIRI|nr:unnamed protein product [Adineta ricciae]